MKSAEREQAQYLYFQTDYTKGQIAEMLKVNRHTISMWAHQGNWDKLRKSARTLPALVAEKCYHLVDSYASGILGDPYTSQNINIRHAQTIHLLASSIKKLKNRSTVNETMEMFNFFLDNLNRRNPALAAQIVPEVDEYLRARGDATVNDHLTSSFSEDGSIPFPADELTEQSLDQQDADLLNQEFEEFLHQRQPYTEPIPAVEEQDSPTEPDTPAPTSDDSSESVEPENAGMSLSMDRSLSPHSALSHGRSLSPHPALSSNALPAERTVPPRSMVSSERPHTRNSSSPDDPLAARRSNDSLTPSFPWR